MVGKIAYLFPGQGSQYLGMGKSESQSSSSAKQYLERADDILKFGLSKIMFEGPEEKLKETDITQPAMFLVSAMSLELLKEKGIKPSWVAGHSLGEYSALYSAGVLNFEQTLRLVYERGKAMKEAVLLSPGIMAAVIGLDLFKINEICEIVTQSVGVCSTANFNSPSQVVISGTSQAILKATALLMEAGAAKVMPLHVGGGFHSSLMSPAAQMMKIVLEQTHFSSPNVPVITNVDAKSTTNPEDFREKLIQQIDHSVLWHPSLVKLLELGADTFVEVGAGKVLSVLAKKLDPQKVVLWTDDFEGIKRLTQVLAAQ